MKQKSIISKDGDVRELTCNDMRKFRPAREAMPQIVAAYKAGTLRPRGRPTGSNKTPVSLRLDNEVLDFFKSKGPGWQTRIDKALKAFVEAVK